MLPVARYAFLAAPFAPRARRRSDRRLTIKPQLKYAVIRVKRTRPDGEEQRANGENYLVKGGGKRHKKAQTE